MAALARERSLSPAVEDYVKIIYKLEMRAGGVVSTGALSQRLEVSPSSTSAMLNKLRDLHLIVHQPYHGVVLTPAGRRLALNVLRRHRLVELFLTEVLGMTWDQVHDEAEVLEHAVSEQVTELICYLLGNPRRDPHGDPIPTRDGSLEEPVTASLENLRSGEAGRLSRVSDADPAVLRQLTAAGIRVDDWLEVVQAPAADGGITVRFGSEVRTLPSPLVRAMRVETETPAAVAARRPDGPQ